MSRHGAQAVEGDGDEPAGGGLRGQAACRGESVQAVAGQLAGGDVVPYLAGLGGPDDQANEESVQLLPGAGDELALMQQRRELAAVVAVLLHAQGVRLKDGPEPPAPCGRGGVPCLGELGELAGDLALVPGGQDRLDVGEVLVQRGAPDASAPGDL